MRKAFWQVPLVALLCAAIGYWFVNETEWVRVEVDAPLKGEAAKNPNYAAMRLLRELGHPVIERHDLDQLPPPGSTLVLESWHWALFPERVQRLQAWVEHGGHLVMPGYLLNSNEAFRKWLPLEADDTPPKRPTAASAASAASAAMPPSARARRSPSVRELFNGNAEPPCAELREPAERAGAFGEPRAYRVCAWGGLHWRARAGTEVQWSIVEAQGVRAMRVRAGQGSVATPGLPWGRRILLQGDNGLLFVASLGAPPASPVWFVVDESRTPVLVWLWQQGSAVVVLALLALALALWRGAVRFGPQLDAPPRGRRSVGEQVRGTAEFIWYRDPQALQAAALRALDEVARRQVRGYERMPLTAKAAAIAAIAALAGLDGGDLGRAMDGRTKRPRAAWPHVLALLETARRRLLERAARRPSPASTPPSSFS